jgi:hypothetical protein
VFKRQHESYYLFENKKTKETVKVITKDDEQPLDIQWRYKIDKEYLFKGIYDLTTNALLSKGVRFVGEDPYKEENPKEETKTEL